MVCEHFIYIAIVSNKFDIILEPHP